MAYINSLECCGVKELCEISDSIRGYSLPFGCKNVLLDMYGDLLESDNGDGKGVRRCAHVLFTSVGRYGEQFANYIREHKLGVVTQSPEATNPNSDNELTAWIWTVDWPAYIKHVAPEQVEV